jgi:RNA polymerase sigma factor (sigma-70 family)
MYEGRAAGELEHVPAPGLDPEEATASAEWQEALRAALESLPPAEREAVVRYDIEGESFVDIAADLGVDEGTIRHRRTRGLKKLGIVLEPYRDMWEGA